MMISTNSFALEHNAEREGRIQVSGGEIWYKIVGVGKQGTPLLVLHGGPGAPHDYLESLADLADERPVIFYDQLGCGNSDRPDDSSLWTVSRFVEELDIVRQALDLDEIHLLGQSWGSMLAVEYIKQINPNGVKSLILSAPYLSTELWSLDQRRLIEAMDTSVKDAILKAEEDGSYDSPAYQNAMMAFYQKHLCRLEPWPDSMIRTMEKMGMAVYNQMWGPSEFTITGSLIGADLRDFLPSLNMPVLYTCGEYDEATPQTTELYHHLSPGSQIYVFEGASHQHHIESQEAYIDLVRGFLADHE